MSLLRAFSFRVRGMSRATGCPRSVMAMTCPAFALATHTLARCRSSRIPIFSTFTLEITCSSETSQRPSLRFPGMDHREVSELAEELAQVTCAHLPWSDQRVIALELGVGECDL